MAPKSDCSRFHFFFLFPHVFHKICLSTLFLVSYQSFQWFHVKLVEKSLVSVPLSQIPPSRQHQLTSGKNISVDKWKCITLTLIFFLRREKSINSQAKHKSTRETPESVPTWQGRGGEAAHKRINKHRTEHGDPWLWEAAFHISPVLFTLLNKRVIKLILKSVRLAWNTVKGIKKKKPVQKEVNFKQDQEPG